MDAQVRSLLPRFFQEIGILKRFRFCGVDAALEQSFFSAISGWSLDMTEEQLQRYATVGLVMATTAYRHTPPDVQLAIALYTFFLPIIDDDDILSYEMIRQFPSRLLEGSPQLHPVLVHLVDNLASMRHLFPIYSATTITADTIVFMNAEVQIRDGGEVDIRRDVSVGYVDYIRMKTGLGEAYAAFIWPQLLFPETKRYIQTLPHVAKFIALGNDLLSFYKESAAGETENYVSQYTASHGVSEGQALSDITDTLVDLDARIKLTLGAGPERDAWESFLVGYAEFHLHNPRYRLSEILPEYCVVRPVS
ncbi:terpene cyclase [Steccherinum ochraceum]|uniref:Terpene cyclase n=1 Tax=Steccherinum ochraceum TaxID=92696 RepID=A0A4V2MWY2_9APHY|nr:terpene cyclase [Steccherinum ochraceum]